LTQRIVAVLEVRVNSAPSRRRLQITTN
jgi:hypothetical protein